MEAVQVELIEAIEALKTIPAWLGTAVIGALIALFSFVAKTLYEWRLDVRQQRAAKLASLLELASLLRAGWVIYTVQNTHARNLYKMLQQSHPEQLSRDYGFDEAFTQLYDYFRPEEAELHGLIRSTTEHAMRPLNESMRAWLKQDIFFKTAFIRASDKKGRLLAERLYDLEAHLILWEAKYRTWIPQHPKHAMVLLDDEKAHGIAFPFDIEKVIKDTVQDLSKSAPNIPL